MKPSSTLLLGLITLFFSACGMAPQKNNETGGSKGTSADAGLSNITARQKNPAVPPGNSTQIDYATLLRRAVLQGPWGEPALLAKILPPEGDMRCGPAAIDSKNPTFTLTLPADLKQREHTLVALSPAGGVYEIYTPYKGDVETADITVPNDLITWPMVQTQNSFTLSAESFDGLWPHDERPTGVFLQAGAYVLALTDGLDRKALKANGVNSKLKVYAACSIYWTP